MQGPFSFLLPRVSPYHVKIPPEIRYVLPFLYFVGGCRHFYGLHIRSADSVCWHWSDVCGSASTLCGRSCQSSDEVGE
ncbi:hypothetical protein FBUS_09056 [Fasciolopsis buskii]|uniref:Uncharacterized protein n=1 Tax=Fasciolopsis buskii TaxID=27845 RepID=A0A8E0S1Z1_9TREM|nr:hypothetical protein FBUS_09056 [Fasciolopsis buski]